MRGMGVGGENVPRGVPGVGESRTPSRSHLADVTCRHCGAEKVWIEWRLEAKAPGTHSLAGMAMKLAATSRPYAVCDGCGHTSRGQQD